jgi:hypothetical protein
MVGEVPTHDRLFEPYGSGAETSCVAACGCLPVSTSTSPPLLLYTVGNVLTCRRWRAWVDYVAAVGESPSTPARCLVSLLSSTAQLCARQRCHSEVGRLGWAAGAPVLGGGFTPSPNTCAYPQGCQRQSVLGLSDLQRRSVLASPRSHQVCRDEGGVRMVSHRNAAASSAALSNAGAALSDSSSVSVTDWARASISAAVFGSCSTIASSAR